MAERRGARLRVHPRERASDLRVEIPHIRLEDFVKPAPPGWSAREFKVDQLPDEEPVRDIPRTPEEEPQMAAPAPRVKPRKRGAKR